MRVFLCEKPSQGKDIAKVLNATKRGEGCFIGNGITVTWCIGHLLETAAPDAYDERYKAWRIDDLPIIPHQWKLVVKKKTASQYKAVKSLIAEATEVVIATDADREGEMIARELLDYCKYRGPIRRLWLSALNSESIRKALTSLKPSDETYLMYHSALARSRADWLIGMNLSRLFTLLAQTSGYQGILSVGRVQTPTLKLVVDRDRAIAGFVSNPFWRITVQMEKQAKYFTAEWMPSDSVCDEDGRCISYEGAKSALTFIQSATKARVISITTERIREVQPLLFDLGSLQEVCSSKLGLGVQETLDIAQALYETHKATTYPRSDCGYLPENMFDEANTVLAAVVRSDPGISNVIKKLNTAFKSRAWNDKKVTAHHGIIPVLESVDLSRLTEKERAVYGLIRNRYLAQFLPHHEYDRTVVIFDAGGCVLKANGKQVAIEGWKELFYEGMSKEQDEFEAGSDSKENAQHLPSLTEDDYCFIQKADCLSLKTKPPKQYTQGELLKAMKGVAKFVSDPRLKQKLKETTGIGTEATRASIIEGLIDRKYLLKKGRVLVSSDAAKTLIDAVPPAIADPGTTAIWEQALDMVERGTLKLDDFIIKQSTWITQIIQKYAAASFSIKLPLSPPCPLCASPMRKRKGSKGVFWSCSAYPGCKGTLNIDAPKKGSSNKSATAASIQPTNP